MSEAPVEPRVGDRERRAADEQLQAAVGDGVLTLAEYDERAGLLWQARTRRDVEALLADLPSAHPVVRTPAPAGPVRPQRVLAVMSEETLTGAVLPGQDVRGWAVMGKAVVDLRRADLPDGVRVRVRAVMGEVEVQVPPGTRVQLSGMALMGERKVRVAEGSGPLVHVDAYAVMGAVNVTVGDGSVVGLPPGAPAPHGSHHGHSGWPASSARVTPVPAQPRSLARRLAQRVAGIGVAGALALGAVGVVASGTDARAVFGSTTERVGGATEDGSVAVSVLFGSVQVVVPDGARVDTDGLVVFGSVDCEAACAGGGEGPSIDVRSLGGFGSVEILTQSEAEAKDGVGEPVVEVEPGVQPPD